MPLSLQNVEVHVILTQREVAQSWYALSLRASGGWVQSSGSPGANTVLPANGYVFRYQGVNSTSSNNVLRRVVDGSSTDLLTNVAIEDAPDGSYHERNIKLRMDGSTLGVKSWLTGSDEPAYTEVENETQFTGAGEIRFGVATNNNTMTSTSSALGGEERPQIRRITVTNLDNDTVVFDDEFIGTADDPVDDTKWTADIASSSDIVIHSNETSAAVTIGAENDHVRLTALEQTVGLEESISDSLGVTDSITTDVTSPISAALADTVGATDDVVTDVQGAVGVPSNVQVTVTSRTSATVTWDDVASADVFQVQARVRAGGQN